MSLEFNFRGVDRHCGRYADFLDRYEAAARVALAAGRDTYNRFCEDLLTYVSDDRNLLAAFDHLRVRGGGAREWTANASWMSTEWVSGRWPASCAIEFARAAMTAAVYAAARYRSMRTAPRNALSIFRILRLALWRMARLRSSHRCWNRQLTQTHIAGAAEAPTPP